MLHNESVCWIKPIYSTPSQRGPIGESQPGDTTSGLLVINPHPLRHKPSAGWLKFSFTTSRCKIVLTQQGAGLLCTFDLLIKQVSNHENLRFFSEFINQKDNYHGQLYLSRALLHRLLHVPHCFANFATIRERCFIGLQL